ncbi:unnamed protein product [Pylaiella littoralis]
MKNTRINHPKLRIRISPTCVDCETLDNVIRSNYDKPVYCGIHSVAGDIYVYIHNRERMSSIVLTKLLHDILHILEITKFSLFEGPIMDSTGTILRHGGNRDHKKRKRAEKSSTINITNNTNNINNNKINPTFVNSIGQESLDHITPEFILELLAERHGPGVIFEFGTKMYSVQENMNFKTDVKSGFVSGPVGDDSAWVTHRKNEGFSILLDNLKDKTEEAVQKYVDRIPEEDADNFELDMSYIKKISDLQEEEPMYSKFIRDGFNVLAANINHKTKMTGCDTGKKLKLF